MNEYWKRSGQIPAFGNWDIANELPITQYFENARQARLIHYSSSSCETDLYAVDHKKPVRKAKRIRDRRYTNNMVNDTETTMKKQVKVYDVKEHTRKQTMNKKKVIHVDDVVHPKPVDEDLYKISPQLLRKTKRLLVQKKMLGFISCLVPAACVS
ncbi:hypothetical protein RYX36_032830 [Vicia faba]